MKKYFSGLLSAVLILSLIVLSGCSDFDFNPLGRWEYHEEIYYVDGKEVRRVGKEDMAYDSMTYIFEKSGTGYIEVDDTHTIDFTYDYDDKNIFMHMILSDKLNKSEIANKDGMVDVEYTVYNNEKDGSEKLIRTEEYKAEDENGKEVSVKCEYILLKQ